MRIFKRYGAHTLSAAALCAIIAGGCGDSSHNNSAISPVNNAPGASGYGWNYKICFQGLAPCVATPQFESTCRTVGGSLTNKYGPAVCVVSRQYGYSDPYSFYSSNRLPIITPSHPEGGVDTGIHLRKGARLDYSTRSKGKWGYLQESNSSFWGGRIKFNWFGSTCSSIDWNGIGKKGLLTNEGEPAGLFGSDGVESFFLGGSSVPRSITIQHEGTLRLGINAEPSTPYGCTTAGYPRITQTTCEDANGASYTCL